MQKASTKITLNVLLAGKVPQYKKYAGKHVMVVRDIVIPLKRGEDFWKDFMRLEKKYGEKPVITFVPSPDISYTLVVYGN